MRRDEEELYPLPKGSVEERGIIMSIRSGVVVLGALALSTTALGQVVPSVVETDRASVLGSFVPVDLSTQPFTSSGTFNNEYTVNFVSPGSPLDYSGSVKLEVFGNVGSTGGSLTDVVLIYTFTSNNALFGVDGFEFGIDGSNDLDAVDLLGATHGRINAETTAGQLSPTVSLDQTTFINNHWLFDFINTEGGGGNDSLGMSADETFTWYIRTTADIQLNLTEVNVLNSFTSQIMVPAPVNVPGQADLGVPAPGATALLLGAGLVASRRRRG